MQVVEAKRAQFADSAPRQVQATVGEPLRLPCQPTAQSVPVPTVGELSWVDEDNNKWQTNPRVQIDDQGLYIIACSTYLLCNRLPAHLRRTDINSEQFNWLLKTLLFGCCDRGRAL